MTVAVITTGAATARAGELGGEASVTTVESYRLQILAADAAGIAVAAAGAQLDSDAILGAGVFIIGIAPAGVHEAHGNHLGAGVSLALRPALVLAGALIGASRDPVDGGFGTGVVGGAVGYAAAIAIDAGLLARIERRARLTPQVTVRGDRVQVGVGGAWW